MNLLSPTRFYPPAPTPHKSPLGPFALLLTLRRNPLEIWCEDDFRLPMQLRKTIVDRRALVNDPAAIRRIFVDNVRNYEKNELQLRLLRPALGVGIITSNGDAWRRQRQMMASLFTPQRVKAFAVAQAAAAQQCAERIAHVSRACSEHTLDVATEMGRLTLEILEHTLFGQGLACEPSMFQQAIAHYLETLGRLDYFDLVGLPDWLPRLNRLTGRKSLQHAARVVNEMIGQRRALLERGAPAPQDLITLLLSAHDAEGQAMSERELHDNIVSFIGAGHETSANALTWILYLLSQSPAWRARVEAEIDAHAHEGPAFTDLPVTRAVIEETLRLYPPIPMMSRIAHEDDTLSGVAIPAGTIVTVAAYVLHRHQTLWSDPHAFDPERFMGTARENIQRHAYIPFGAGARVCIGMSFAMTEMLVVLRCLLGRFRFDLVPGHRVMPQVRVAMRPQHGMMMRISTRQAGRP
ncbi:cytochrome P450 [Burkholderia ubonensis]|uniref:cytochrome P450 n=1 Tax=Burkholderia ubonensis TaxID=101571 RepID=UPI0007C788E4|nr:cytochrome P450 [Burkholderia ubonensis]